jgi:hypothetical protein
MLLRTSDLAEAMHALAQVYCPNEVEMRRCSRGVIATKIPLLVTGRWVGRLWRLFAAASAPQNVVAGARFRPIARSSFPSKTRTYADALGNHRCQAIAVRAIHSCGQT